MRHVNILLHTHNRYTEENKKHEKEVVNLCFYILLKTRIHRDDVSDGIITRSKTVMNIL